MTQRSPAIESFASFGELLKYLRRRERLTQQQLGIAVGYSEGQISRMESNQRVPDAATLRALFVPALHLQNESETAARLLKLAEAARKASFVGTDIPLDLPNEKRHNLPAELTSLVGRETELAEIARLLELSTTRLLTLTGSGGCGKTRLALRSGRDLAARYPHGVWMVELAPLSDPDLILQAIVGTLGLAVEPGHSPREVLTAFLRERELLLILDNCEHLIDAVASLALSLLRACQQLTLLATSREVLGVPGEITYHVPSLALPSLEWDGAPMASAAAQLFLERAASVHPGYVLAKGDAPILAQICRRLDGIPLAIELAAARVNALPLSLIASRLEEGFRILGSGSRGIDPRHVTLRAAVEWSYQLLSEAERILLRRLPLFAGGWQLEQAEDVCACDGLEGQDVLELMTALVRKSLVQTEHLPGGNMRYRLHEMVRQYARERLAESGEEECLQRRFLDYFTCLAESSEQGLQGPDQMVWLAQLDRDRDNLNEALRLAFSTQDAARVLRISGPLSYYWIMRGQLVEGERWLQAALALHGPLDLNNTAPKTLAARAKALIAIFSESLYTPAIPAQEVSREAELIYRALNDPTGVILARCQNYPPDAYDTWVAELTDAVQGLISAGDHWNAGYVLEKLGKGAQMIGDFKAYAMFLEGSAVQYRQAGDLVGLARLDLRWMAWLFWNKGDIRGALALTQKAANILRDAGVHYADATSYFQIAYYHCALGDFAGAYASIEEAFLKVRAIGAYQTIPVAHWYKANAFLLDRRLDESRVEIEQALVTVESIPTTWGTGQRLLTLGLILYFQGQLEQAAEVLSESLNIHLNDPDASALHSPLRALGRIRLAQDDLPAARNLLLRSLAEITRNRTLPDFPETLDLLAQLVLAEGKPDLAAHLLGASDGLLARMEMVRYPVYQPDYQSCCADCTAALGETEFKRFYSDGMEKVSGSSPIEMINAFLSQEAEDL